MAYLKVAAVQMRSGLDPVRNVEAMERLVREAAALGAAYVQTPEMTGAVVRTAEQRRAAFTVQAKDGVVAAASRLARAVNRSSSVTIQEKFCS